MEEHLTWEKFIRKLRFMFVSVVGEFSVDDHKSAVFHLLKQYGFKMVIKDVFESETINSQDLNRLKRDIDRVTDSYDIIRFYQFPLDDALAITSLKEKKWRRWKIKVMG